MRLFKCDWLGGPLSSKHTPPMPLKSQIAQHTPHDDITVDEDGNSGDLSADLVKLKARNRNDGHLERMLVLAGCGHGQRRVGVELAPKRLLTFSTFNDELIDSLSASQHLQSDEAETVMIPINTVPILRPKAVARLNLRLHEAIYDAGLKHIEKGTLPKILTLGGDHSIAIGCVSAISNLLVKSHERGVRANFSIPCPIVFWVDAHADINTPRSTDSGKLHGCPVSFLAGIDKESWSHLPDFKWAEEKLALRPPDMRKRFIDCPKLVYIATRDLDPPEEAILGREQILEYSMTVVKARNRDLKAILLEALTMVDPRGQHPIHISFDIDSLDPSFAASTGTPVPDGLTAEEGEVIIKVLGETGRLVSMDLVEVNPSLGTPEDVEKTLHSAARLIRAFDSEDHR